MTTTTRTTKPPRTGSLVTATTILIDENLHESGTSFVHATPGQKGRVLDVDDQGFLLVAFEHSPHAIEVDPDHVRPYVKPPTVRAGDSVTATCTLEWDGYTVKAGDVGTVVAATKGDPSVIVRFGRKPVIDMNLGDDCRVA